jgi:DNA-directed RNA polymerase subunit M/transcription elongation factor TFIIS
MDPYMYYFILVFFLFILVITSFWEKIIGFFILKDKPKKVDAICPKCGSTDISWNLSKEAVAKGSFQNEHICNNCGYEGSFFPEPADEKEYITACPKCGSINVHGDLSKDMIAWGGSTRWVCGDCDYSAPLFPDVCKMQFKKFKKEIGERTKEQEVILNKITASKGMMHNRITFFITILYTIGIFVSFLFTLFIGIGDGNMILSGVSIVFMIVFILLWRYIRQESGGKNSTYDKSTKKPQRKQNLFKPKR